MDTQAIIGESNRHLHVWPARAFHDPSESSHAAFGERPQDVLFDGDGRDDLAPVVGNLYHSNISQTARAKFVGDNFSEAAGGVFSRLHKYI